MYIVTDCTMINAVSILSKATLQATETTTWVKLGLA